jgi:MerR family transcriptional regulator, light-induced transcriptional regulator
MGESVLATTVCVDSPNASPAEPTKNQETGRKRRLFAIVGVLERDVIPGLVRAHLEAGGVSAPEFAREDVEVFVATTIATDDRATAEHVERLLAAGAQIEKLYLSLFAPAARMLGARWDNDTLDVAQVTMGMSRLQLLLHEFRPRFINRAGEGARSVLIVPNPGEQHAFGPMMVAEFFARAGWSTAWEANSAVSQIAHRIRDDHPDLLGLSCAGERFLPGLERSIKAARRAARGHGLVVLVGGRVFTARPQLATEIGADGTANDGPSAVALADRLVPERLHHN